MVAPVNQFTTTSSGYSGGWNVSYEYRVRSRQKFPIDRPTYYHAVRGRLSPSIGSSNSLGSPTYNAQTISSLPEYDSNMDNSTIARAYEKFKGQVYDQAQLGVDFAEYRQSLDMIKRSASTLLKFTHELKRANLPGAARALGMFIVPPRSDVRKSWANNFLEYHFGWSPLLGDIHDALKVLNDPVKNFTSARGRASSWKQFSVSSQLPTSAVWSSDKRFSFYSCQQGGHVTAITNRGLHTLDQFGVLNPLSVAWELVPFSFVVDWFANVGQVLASFSDFAGMTLGGTYWGRKIVNTDVGFTYYRPTYVGVHDAIPMTWTASSVWVDRNLGLSLPVFSVKKLTLPSSTRATTAVALLFQQLRK